MFDPYHKWLGISRKDQPPNHYRLLGLELFESDEEVIDAAANRQMAYLQERAIGEHAALSQKLLNEVSAARLCLLDPKKKFEYDSGLKEGVDAEEEVIQELTSDLLTAELGETTNVQPLPRQPKPSRFTRIRHRFRSFEPWHVAVVVGVAFLVGLGIFAVLSSSRTTTAVAENSSKPGSEGNDAEQAEDIETQVPEIAPADVVDAETVSDGDGEADQTPSPDTSTSVEVTEPEEVIYNVTMSPTSADLTIKYGEAVIEGTGRNRQVRVEDPKEVNNLCVVASCDGYKSKSKYLYPGSSEEEKDIWISLEVNQWISLFNGDSLDGWSARGDQNVWSVRSGCIHGDGGFAVLTYTKSTFADFELVADIKINAKGKSDLAFRAMLKSNGLNGYALGLQGSEKLMSWGGLSRIADVPQSMIKDNSWFHLNLIAEHNHIRVVIDGRTVVDHTDPERKYLRGQLALRSGWGTKIFLRNIKLRQIQDIGPSANDIRPLLQMARHSSQGSATKPLPFARNRPL